MRQVAKYDPSGIPFHAISVVVTSVPDYEMDRVVFVDNWPAWGQYLVLSGSHCSCYGFDETDWFATIFDSSDRVINEKELAILLDGWEEHGWGSERLAVEPIQQQLK